MEGAIDPEDEMLLGGVFHPRIHYMPPLVGPTLVSLGNARRNAIRRPPRHQIVVWNNRTTHGRTGQSSIPRPCLANNGGMACSKQAEGSSRGNSQTNQSNLSNLPFLDMHTTGGSSSTIPLSMCQGPKVTNNNDPLAKWMKLIVRTNVASTSTVELRNLTLEVEGEVQTNYGNEHNVEGTDEREDNDRNVCKEAPNDPDICIWQLLGLDSNTPRRSGHLCSTRTTNE